MILTDLTVEQMSYRIKLRNAQFGFPIDPERERARCTGDGEPIEFDFERAGMTSD